MFIFQVSYILYIPAHGIPTYEVFRLCFRASSPMSNIVGKSIVETEYQNLRQGLKMLKNATIMNDLFNFRTRNKQIIHFRFTKDYLDHFYLHYGPSVSIFQTSLQQHLD